MHGTKMVVGAAGCSEERARGTHSPHEKISTDALCSTHVLRGCDDPLWLVLGLSFRWCSSAHALLVQLKHPLLGTHDRYCGVSHYVLLESALIGQLVLA